MRENSSQSQEKGGETREKILDAAETLFIEKGFSATSLRAIAERASVNLAATNYHFGNKEGLFAAVFHRRIQPINQERLRLLQAITTNSQRPADVRSILEAFFAPFVTQPMHLDSHIPALVGRLHSEPGSMSKNIVDNEFSEVAITFQAAFRQVLPGVTEESLQWRFHFMVGSMIHLLQYQAPLGSQGTKTSLREAIPELIAFVEHGLRQDTNKANS